MTPADFDSLFDTFHSTVFRLEALPAYAVGGDERKRIEAAEQGAPRPERSVRTSRWLARIATTTVAGKAWSRVRVVDDPLTDYQRRQLVSYAESQAVGEQIHLVRRVEVGEVGVDFWLFDGGTSFARAVLMHYHPDGSLDRRELVDAQGDLDELEARRRRVEQAAVPLNEFLAGAGRG